MAEESVKNSGKLVGMAPTPPPSTSLAPASYSPLSTALHYNPYPPPLAKCEDVIANRVLFMETLQKLHSAMGTRFWIPIIGGKDLDLHKLFVEVTSRGGMDRILRDKKWKEVTATFNFPSTATNATFMLRKHYFSLLHHYEQMYYLKAQAWAPLPPGGAWQLSYPVPIAVHGAVGTPVVQREVTRPVEPLPQVVDASPSSECIPVTGIIDGKFEGGYLVTVIVGTHKLKGVLYHLGANSTASPTYKVSQAHNTGIDPSQSNTISTTVTPPGIRRRRRRRDINKRDPAHPKPNRSSYNYFFAEQHERLKLLYCGRVTEISTAIGDLWTKLKEDEKAVYQEKADIDKERYRKEMECYREKQRLGQMVIDLDAKMADVEQKEVAERDNLETFEDEEDDGCSMSLSMSDEEADDLRDDVNIETPKVGPTVQSSHEVGQSSVQETLVAPLTLSFDIPKEDTNIEMSKEVGLTVQSGHEASQSSVHEVVVAPLTLSFDKNTNMEMPKAEPAVQSIDEVSQRSVHEVAVAPLTLSFDKTKQDTNMEMPKAEPAVQSIDEVNQSSVQEAVVAPLTVYFDKPKESTNIETPKEVGPAVQSGLEVFQSFVHEADVAPLILSFDKPKDTAEILMQDLNAASEVDEDQK